MRRLVGPDRVLAVLGPTFSNAAFDADPVADAAETPVLAVSNTANGIVGHCAYACQMDLRTNSLPESEALTANVAVYRRGHTRGAPRCWLRATTRTRRARRRVAAAALRRAGVTELPARRSRPRASSGRSSPPPSPVIPPRSSSSPARGRSSPRSSATPTATASKAASSAATGSTAPRSSWRRRRGPGAQSAAGWFIGNPAPANKAFVTSYRHRYGVAPDQFAAQAFTGVMLLARAATKAPLRFENLGDDRAGLRASLAATHFRPARPVQLHRRPRRPPADLGGRRLRDRLLQARAGGQGGRDARIACERRCGAVRCGPPC